MADLLAQPADGFLDRVTMLGMCQISSGAGADASLRVDTSATPLATALARRLAAHLGVDVADLARARREALSRPLEYLGGLWRDARIDGALVDDGYPLPVIDGSALSRESGLPVHRVARIEPMIAELREEASSFAGLEEAFVARVRAAGDAVAFKSVIAYRTGLDVREWAASELGGAFERWRADGFAETREHAKPVRDALLRRTLEVAERPVHIHCGGGDPDVVLGHARPQDLFPTLKAFKDRPIVLIHAGWPWTEEAAYVASILPNVFLDISVMAPWASLAIDAKLEVLLGAAPTSRVLYGSDEASEPEVLWFTAHVVRAALERVLARATERDWTTVEEAQRIGEAVLAGNTRRLHGLS